MPYCNHCGKLVQDHDIFCASCGGRQSSAAPPPPPPPHWGRRRDAFEGISPRSASMLCYVPFFGWIAAVVVLAAQKFRNNHTVRFNAFQGLYLFAVWLFIDWGVRPIFREIALPFYRVDRALEALIFVASIFMIIKASHEERYSLPIIGDLAHRSASES